jgi:hypothetical protein
VALVVRATGTTRLLRSAHHQQREQARHHNTPALLAAMHAPIVAPSVCVGAPLRTRARAPAAAPPAACASSAPRCSATRFAAAATARLAPARLAPARRAARTPLPPPRAESGAAEQPLACPELASLAGCTIYSAASSAPCPAGSLVPPVGTTLVPFFTQFGDFDSFELAQRLVDALPALAAAGVRVAAIGVGTPAAARAFAQFTNFPLDMLYADPDAACYEALRFAPGAGRPGGPLPLLNAVPGQVKLLAMCAGLGSPGTLTEVFRGYLVRIRMRVGVTSCHAFCAETDAKCASIIVVSG